MTKLASLISTKTTACKICGSPAAPYGAVDFNKSCQEQRGMFLKNSGVSIAYQRCVKCQFIFTNAFDDWTPHDFETYIYNDDYKIIDPDYAARRPELHASLLDKLFPNKHNLTALDYGSGHGSFAQCLIRKGFPRIDCFDPFVQGYASLPQKTYDLITCFEVVEHLTHPFAATKDIAACLSKNGVVIYSTLLQNEWSEANGINTWYIAPRNGHVNFHSRESLAIMWQRYDFCSQVLNNHVHVAYRKAHDAAGHFLRTPPSSSTPVDTKTHM